MGKGVDVGAFSFLECSNGVELGDYCELGSHTSIFSRSTIDNTKGPVKIGAFARVGSHTTILPNVSIGDGAIVGAHSLVKSNIPELSLAYGVPAKAIKRI